MVELGDERAHSVVAQAARMVRGGDEAAAECVHAGQRRYLAGITEIIGVAAARQGGAGGRLDRDKIGVFAAQQLVLHKGGDQAAEVGAAAGAANDNVRVFAQLLHCRLGLQADDGLVEQHLV